MNTTKTQTKYEIKRNYIPEKEEKNLMDEDEVVIKEITPTKDLKTSTSN